MDKKRIASKVLYIISVVLLAIFVIVMAVEYKDYQVNGQFMSAPFSLIAHVTALEYLVPSAIVFIVAMVLEKKSK